MWAAFVRDIAPLPRRSSDLSSALKQGAEAPPSPVQRRAEPVGTGTRPERVIVPVGPTSPAVRVTRSAAAVMVGQRLPGVDDTSWRALSTGKMRPQRTLDLHGHAAQAAFLRLHTFLLACAADGVRCVEIITGLGSGAEGGVIRRELPLWLGRADLRGLVLAIVHPHAANRGAVRVLLRRRRR
nr:Smr/MutS family protein [Ameyamaea chiangmaiensis]